MPNAATHEPAPRATRRHVLAGGGATALLAMAGVPALAAPIDAFRPRGTGGADHAAFDRLLQIHVKPDKNGYNRVDYRGFAASGHTDLKSYLDLLEKARPSAFGRAEAHAFWINLYNAKTLDVVLDNYPVRSIKTINLGGGGLFGRGPWSKTLIRVEARDLSLDDVEHRIVRPLFADPMSHYALNCASYSCPNLATRAFTGANLDSLMAGNAAAYVNHARGVMVAGGAITASRLYSWYASDFGGRGHLKRHWNRFATPRLKSAIAAARLDGFVYDWALNDV